MQSSKAIACIKPFRPDPLGTMGNI